MILPDRLYAWEAAQRPADAGDYIDVEEIGREVFETPQEAYAAAISFLQEHHAVPAPADVA